MQKAWHERQVSADALMPQCSIWRALMRRLSAVSHTLHSSQSLAVRLTCRTQQVSKTLATWLTGMKTTYPCPCNRLGKPA